MERICVLHGLTVHNAFVYLFTNIQTMATVLTKKISIQKTAKYYSKLLFVSNENGKKPISYEKKKYIAHI